MSHDRAASRSLSLSDGDISSSFRSVTERTGHAATMHRMHYSSPAAQTKSAGRVPPIRVHPLEHKLACNPSVSFFHDNRNVAVGLPEESADSSLQFTSDT